MSSNIPEARALIEKAIATLKPIEVFDESISARNDLNTALSLMTRNIEKKTVRRNVRVTVEHRRKIAELRGTGAGSRMTLAEIAIEVFGEPVNLGRVSAMMNGREDEYTDRSTEFFAEPV